MSARTLSVSGVIPKLENAQNKGRVLMRTFTQKPNDIMVIKAGLDTSCVNALTKTPAEL